MSAARLAVATSLAAVAVAIASGGTWRTEPRAPAPARSLPAPADAAWLLHGARLDLARADPRALRALPGIGERLAERIVAQRRVRPLCALDALLEVPGIGPRKLAGLRDAVQVGEDARCPAD